MAPAEKIASFCGVARKSQKNLTNYQRALTDKRVANEIMPFFHDPRNCSPTAIILSLQDSPIGKVTINEVEAKYEGIRLKEIEINLTKPDQLTPQEIIDYSKEFFDSRLKDEESEESEESEEIDLGQSMLRKIKQEVDNYKNLDEDSAKALIEILKDMLSPALVIDGQHRLFGAARVEEGIKLLACCLLQPGWTEQVFQFTVINSKAKPIPKPFITSLASMSLVNQEFNEIKGRLQQAGVVLWEVEVMNKLGQDPSSVFYEMIDFKEDGKADQSKIGYQTMKKVGKAWYKPTHTGLVNLAKILFKKKDEKQPTKKDALSRWVENEWFEFFTIFWKHVNEKFTNIWSLEPGEDGKRSNLLLAVTLEVFQDEFLKNLSTTYNYVFTKERMENLNKMDQDKKKEEVLETFKTIFIKEFLSKFKDQHFTREWKMTSLNHSEGKKSLADLFNKVVNSQNISNHTIYTGRSRS